MPKSKVRLGYPALDFRIKDIQWVPTAFGIKDIWAPLAFGSIKCIIVWAPRHRNAASKVFGHPLHCRFKSIWAPTALSVASKAFGHSLHCRIKSIWAPTTLSHQNYLRGTHYIVASKIFGLPLPQLLHQSIWAPTALSHQKHLGTHCIVASKSTAVFGHPLHQLSHQKPRYLDTHCITELSH